MAQPQSGDHDGPAVPGVRGPADGPEVAVTAASALTAAHGAPDAPDAYAYDVPDMPEASARAAVAGLARSARKAGRRAVVSGRWLADTVVEVAPHVPVRDAATLSAHHDGLTGPALARALTRSAGRVSAGIGAATGTLVAAQQLSVAMVVLVPFELAAETALVVLAELKLAAELHEVAGRPFPTGLARGRAALVVWTSGHALPAAPSLPPGADATTATTRTPDATVGPGTTAGPGDGADGPDVRLTPAARRQLVVALRRRFTRNLATLGPLLTGAAAAGVLNRHATVGFAHAVARDLGLRR